MMKACRFTIPIKTVNPMNGREHRMARSRRVKSERNATLYRMPRFKLEPAVVVTLTRIGLGTMDDDAVPGSMKGVRDAIASRFRIDDACGLVEWRYRQERGELPEVRVEIEAYERKAGQP